MTEDDSEKLWFATYTAMLTGLCSGLIADNELRTRHELGARELAVWLDYVRRAAMRAADEAIEERYPTGDDE